jgi:hypothetical protein
MINELPTETSYSYKNIFLYICLFLLVAGGIGTALYFLISRKKSCKTDKDCKSGQTCNGGKCQSPASGCNSDKDCASGQTCNGGKCQSPASGCNTDKDCASGNTCVNGQCQPVVPSSGCSTDSDCAKGHTCVSGKCQPVTPPTTEVTLKNYDDTQSGDVDVLAYYKFISPVNNCKIKNITVHASGDTNNNGFILCAVNLKDGKEIYDSTKAVKFLDKYPNIPGDTSFSGNIDTDIMDVTLNHMENIPILNKEDFIYINWTTNNPKNPSFPKDPYGKIHTYKTNDDNNLAVSLTYTY